MAVCHALSNVGCALGKIQVAKHEFRCLHTVEHEGVATAHSLSKAERRDLIRTKEQCLNMCSAEQLLIVKQLVHIPMSLP